MGDSGSWFGLRRLAALEGGEAAQFFLVGINHPDRHIEEADLPLTGLGLLHGDGLADQGAADMDEVALPLDLAVRSHVADRRLARIVGLWKSVGHLAGRALIEAGRRSLPERLMRTLLVV